MEYKYDQLKKKYNMFGSPSLDVRVGGKSLIQTKSRADIWDVRIDLSTGFEASTAEFSCFNVYNQAQDTYDDDLMKAIQSIDLGKEIEIDLGYGEALTNVFIGVVTRISYSFYEGEVPCIRVTAMDAKGVMMAGSYCKQLKATTYSEAVSEILNAMSTNDGMIGKITVEDTPDKTRSTGSDDKATDVTIEMVAESDYEFIVKAAKKNNFELFIDCGDVYFRKAKNGATKIMTLGPKTGMRSVDISYDITALAKTIEVRSTNIDKAKVFSSKKNIPSDIPEGSKAKDLIKNSKKVYLDSSVRSKEDADDRVASLVETISYRYGSLYAKFIGMPELRPGNKVDVTGLASGKDNTFYLTKCTHTLSPDGLYFVEIEGCCNTKTSNKGGGLK